MVADPFKLSIREAKARGSLRVRDQPTLGSEFQAGQDCKSSVYRTSSRKAGLHRNPVSKKPTLQPPPKKDDCLQKGVDISELQYFGEIGMLQD